MAVYALTLQAVIFACVHHHGLEMTAVVEYHHA